VSGGTGHGDRREIDIGERMIAERKNICFTSKSKFDNIGANRRSRSAKEIWLESGSGKSTNGKVKEKR